MATFYRAGEVSQRLGVPPSTLRLYSVRFAAWLSEGAAAPGGAGGRRGHRSYTEEDVALLARVKALLARGRTVAEVQAALGPARRGPVGAPGGAGPSAPDGASAEVAGQSSAAAGGGGRPAVGPEPRGREVARPTEGADGVGAEPRRAGAVREHELGAESVHRAADTRPAGPSRAPAASSGATTEQVVALALCALAEAQHSEAVWRGLLERRRQEADWLRAELLRQEVDLARLAVRLGERMRVILRRVEQIAEPVRELLDEHAAEAQTERRRQRSAKR